MTNTVSRIVSDDTLNKIIQIESSGNPNIRARTSSATGLMQALNATWLGVVRAHRPDLLKNRSDAAVLALRLDPNISIEMLARFTEDNLKIIGTNAPQGDIYLAHFLGAGTARKVIQAPAGALAINYTGSAAAKANPTIITAKTTVAQLRAWAAKKMSKKPAQDWVAKYYKGTGANPLPLSLMGDDADTLIDELAPNGDLNLQVVQTQLKGMNYYTGMLDGLWGSKTSGAIAGFLNDFGVPMDAPTTMQSYRSKEATIREALDRAEDRNFVRPVTAARKEQAIEVVDKIAPEAAPARKSVWSSIFAFLASIIAAIWTTISDYASTIWNFFTANRDNIPASATDPSYVMKLVHMVPAPIWFFLLAAVFGFIGFKSVQSLRKINDAVSTGER